MYNNYLETIIQYLAKVIQSNSENQNKLDEVIDAVHNIKISANSVNLNTDELEEKLDNIKASIESITSKLNNPNYLNPPRVDIVEEGDTDFEQGVVLFNITDENITINATCNDMTQAVDLILVPGWNPVVVKSITGAPADTLMYGW